MPNPYCYIIENTLKVLTKECNSEHVQEMCNYVLSVTVSTRYGLVNQNCISKFYSLLALVKESKNKKFLNIQFLGYFPPAPSC